MLNNNTNTLTSETNIERAYAQLCDNRRHYPANSDIWDMRYHWPIHRQTIINKITCNQYVFSPLRVVTKVDGSQAVIWSSPDAFVINLLTIYLTSRLPVHERCEHIKGHGGGKQSILKLNQIIQNKLGFHYVCRTDIEGYYAHINKMDLLTQLSSHITDSIVLDLLSQFLHYTIENGGNFHTPRLGIARSSSLSPLLAAFHLYHVDSHFAQHQQCHYIRYMDDFIILTKTRWHLKQAVRQLNQFFNDLGFRQYPDKTFIGNVSKGFDWMGFWFNHHGCQSVAPRAHHNHQMKLTRLLEQVRKLPAKQQAIRTMSYTSRWHLWQDTILTAITSASQSQARSPAKYQAG